MIDFQDKVAFITGGASGLGLAMARAFLKEGMRVVIADIEKSALEKAVADLGEQARGIQLDVSDRQAVYAAADEAESFWGKVHVLCNNAGIGAGGPIGECSDNDWDWTMGVNLNGVFYGIQAFLPKLRSHGEGGYIINTASMAGFLAGPMTVAYATSKFAVVGLSESMANHLAATNIGVSVLCPAVVDTEIFNAERNRPASLPGDKEPLSPEEGKALLLQSIGMAGEQFAKVLQPNEVGPLVVAAMKARQLYIFPHYEFLPLLAMRQQQRADAMEWAEAQDQGS